MGGGCPEYPVLAAWSLVSFIHSCAISLARNIKTAGAWSRRGGERPFGGLDSAGELSAESGDEDLGELLKSGGARVEFVGPVGGGEGALGLDQDEVVFGVRWWRGQGREGCGDSPA